MSHIDRVFKIYSISEEDKSAHPSSKESFTIKLISLVNSDIVK
jgi:hypothetical protein